VVIIGNDDACQMAGISTVPIKMFDGMVRDLTDVRHVPQMKRTLSQLELWSQRDSK